MIASPFFSIIISSFLRRKPVKYSIALVPGDGIGPDVIAQATEVLDAAGDRFGHVFNYVELEAG
ncbi:MAG: hypothetical protein LBU28_11430, partial [Spirochaetaceae bacterium]|nr:hypothetical protein [Spirochaetaceae bacterium]